MPSLNTPDVSATLGALASMGLLKGHETDAILALGRSASPVLQEVGLAETLHVHIKVDDTHALPLNRFFAAGAQLDHQKDGFVKYRFPGGVNAIFSHIKVSQDELAETEATRRERPFLDHIGIDLRDETANVQRAFAALPQTAQTLGWGLSSQGGPDRPVFCCHVEVAAKHWLYPPDTAEAPGIPIEFAYGELKVNPEKSGCDLRPTDPAKIDPDAPPTCCGAAPDHDTAKSEADAPTAEAGSYYQQRDLARFGEMGRVNPGLAKAFFDYYGQVMAEGMLTRREKALIALAVSHALKCPYCIDSTTGTLQSLHVGEPEMNEAVHVASAMSAGVTLVHGVQMMNRLDR